MFSRIFYFALGFAVGYFIDSIRQDSGSDEVRPRPINHTDPAEESVVVESHREEETPDFLQQINGIGPAYAQRLFDGGIRSYWSLANATAEELTSLAKARSQAQAEDWIEQAKNYLK